MKKLKSENGYSLLLTLILVLLFSILGASLMTLTFNGSTKNETREALTQAQDLASKGIEKINAQITQELNAAVTSEGITASKYLDESKIILDKFKCQGGTHLSENLKDTTVSKYKVCIDKIEDDLNSLITINNQQKYLRKIITLKSIGNSQDKERTLYAKYNIGATEYPEVLNYAIGTFLMPYSKISDGDGNLYLNGGVSISGDLQVASNLITTSNGYRSSGSTDISQASVLPEIKGTVTDSSSKIFVGKDLYRFEHFFNYSSSGKYFNYKKYTGTDTAMLNSTFSSYGNIVTKVDNIKELFHEKSKGPIKITTSTKIEPFNFTTKYNSLFFTNKQASEKITVKEKDNKFTVDKGSSKSSTFLTNESCGRSCDDNTIILNKKISFNRLATTHNIKIPYHETEFNFTNGIYVGGNLEIGDPLYTTNYWGQNVPCQRDSPKKIKLTGIIYVKGNVSLCNIDLTSNVIIYADGEVTLKESQIIGDKVNNRTTSLIIFSKSDINISNNSLYENEPSKIKGYFYSERDLEIYGVGSNISIEGGISANKIILNAIRGDFKKENVYPTYAEQAGSKFSDSRLQIHYDPDIISNYSVLDTQSEPWINNISSPTEIDRSYDSP